MLLLALLAVLAQCTIPHITPPDWGTPYFLMDLMVTPNPEFQGPRATDYDRFILGAGTECRIYIKNGNQPVVYFDGLDSVDGTHTSKTDPRVRELVGQDIRMDQNTYVWTNCNDALLVDFFLLTDGNGNYRYWGFNNHKAWCISTDRRDADFFNGMADIFFTTVSNRRRRVVDHDCFYAMRLQPDGGLWGWYHSESSNAAREHVSESMISYLGGLPRRALQDDELPTKQDVLECQADPAKTEEECHELVEEIFSYMMEHDEELFVSADELNTDEEEYYQQMFDQIALEHQGEVGTDGDDSGNEGDSDIRRRLFKLL